MRSGFWIAAWMLVLAPSEESTLVPLHEPFLDGWDEAWMVRGLGKTSNHHQVEHDDGNPVLRIESTDSASALWRMVNVHPVEHRLAWRWKISESLSRNRRERKRDGDDFAARVFVIFDPVLFDLQMRAICYVWSGRTEPGTVYRSPYSKNIAMVVLQSGDAKAGEWTREERDIGEDFRRFFGEYPDMVTAVALMVDTDNTGERATAWFDDIELRAAPDSSQE